MIVGFVGAGAMGAPMVQRLVGAGHHVQVYGRRDETRRSALDAGAVVVDTVDQVTSEATVVVLCPFTDDQVREIAIDGGVLAAMRPESVLVLHTTGSPGTARSLQQRAPERVSVVDSPVSGSPVDIAEGHITLFMGGADEAVAAVDPVLSAYGEPRLHVGPLGAGQAVKLLNNALFAAHLQLAADATRIAGQLGVDPAVAAASVARGSGASRAVEILGGDPSRLEGLRRFLDKDVDVLRDAADELGVDLGLLWATNVGGEVPFGS